MINVVLKAYQELDLRMIIDMNQAFRSPNTFESVQSKLGVPERLLLVPIPTIG